MFLSLTFFCQTVFIFSNMEESWSLDRIARFQGMGLSNVIQGVCFVVLTILSFTLFGIRHSKRWVEEGGWTDPDDEQNWLDKFAVGE